MLVSYQEDYRVDKSRTYPKLMRCQDKQSDVIILARYEEATTTVANSPLLISGTIVHISVAPTSYKLGDDRRWKAENCRDFVGAITIKQV
jgi:hypothetical protein